MSSQKETITLNPFAGEIVKQVRLKKNKIRHVFVMTGADPNTGWLNGCIVLDAKGFINTGPDLSSENLSATGWSLKRQPYLLETSLPGIFALVMYAVAH